VTLHITPPTGLTGASDDTCEMFQDVPEQVFSVLLNDTSAVGPGGLLVVTALTAPAHGTAAISTDQKAILYTSAAGFVGDDTLIYTVLDLTGATATAAVHITVLAEDEPAGPCDLDTLTGLVVPGLAPAFDPATLNYGVPPANGGGLAVTPAACDPAVAIAIKSTPVASGSTFGAWVGDGGPVDVVLYRNGQEVARYTLTLDASLPPPPPAPVVSSLSAPGLDPAFDPAITDYTRRQRPADHGGADRSQPAPRRPEHPGGQRRDLHGLGAAGSGHRCGDLRGLAGGGPVYGARRPLLDHLQWGCYDPLPVGGGSDPWCFVACGFFWWPLG